MFSGRGVAAAAICAAGAAGAPQCGAGDFIPNTCVHDSKHSIVSIKGDAAASAATCCAACSNHTGCESWNQWVKNDVPMCKLFNGPGGLVSGDCTSGTTGPIPPPVPPPSSGPPPPGPACTNCPNILFLFTDDQDMLIGGWDPTAGAGGDPMQQTKRLIQQRGATASEWRIHTPICAPSRAELQSGRYFHNIKSKEFTPSPKVSGGAVGQVDLSGKVWPRYFTKTLRAEKGYVTAQFGKCMNGGCSGVHLTGAFDRWFEGTGFTNTNFFDNEAPGCTWPWKAGDGCSAKTSPGGEWAGKGDGYDTSTIGNKTVEWIHRVAGQGRPFFVYFAPHAPHSPATPAKWYTSGTRCAGVTSPRLPNWNYSGPRRTSCSALPPSGAPPFGSEPVWWWNSTDFHELTSCQPYFDDKDVNGIDSLAEKRCRALLSVDDAYAGIIGALEDAGVMNSTYVMVSSDHGYNLGHHMLPSNKFLLYEHSLRIPMLFMGPGIKAGSTVDFLGTQVDIAPTILGLAGIDTPEWMDGRSIVPLLIDAAASDAVPRSVAEHAAALGAGYAARLTAGRTSSYHEYYNQGPWEVGSRHPLDDWSNTYIAVRYKGPQGSWKYGEYDPYGKQTNFTRPYMYELFDLDQDPYELHNVYNATQRSNPSLISMLHSTVRAWYECAGPSCS